MERERERERGVHKPEEERLDFLEEMNDYSQKTHVGFPRGHTSHLSKILRI